MSRPYSDPDSDIEPDDSYIWKEGMDWVPYSFDKALDDEKRLAQERIAKAQSTKLGPTAKQVTASSMGPPPPRSQQQQVKPRNQPK